MATNPRSLMDTPGAIQEVPIPASTSDQQPAVPVPEAPSTQETPHQFDSSPFEPDRGNTFENVNFGPPEPNASQATPVRTMIAAAALLSDPQPDDNLSSPHGVIRALDNNQDRAANLIDNGQEPSLRAQAAIRLMQERDAALRRTARNLGPNIDPRVSQAITTTLNVNRQADLEARSRVALEETAVNNIRDLVAAGNDSEARALLDRYRVGRRSTLDVISDDAQRQLLLASALERANIEHDNESWIHAILSTIISVPASFLMNDTFSQLGNVDPGVGGYDPRTFRFFTPTTELANQVEAIRGLNAPQLAEYLPRLIQNIRDNATTLGVFNPRENISLLENIANGISPEQQTIGNIESNINLGLLLPIGLAARLGKTAVNIARVGSRSLAARSVARAFEETAVGGTTRTGMDVADVEAESLPSAVNPHVVPGDPVVSLSGQVSDTIEQGQRVAAEIFGPTEEAPRGQPFGIPAHGRLQNATEVDAAVDATTNELEGRVGGTLHDVQVNRLRLATGSELYRVEGMVGPFATRQEAVGHAVSHGLYTDESVIVERSAAPATAEHSAVPTPNEVPKGSRVRPLNEDVSWERTPANDEEFSDAQLRELENSFHEDVRDMETTAGRPLTGKEKDDLWQAVLDTAAEGDATMAHLKSARNPNIPQNRLAESSTPVLPTPANEGFLPPHPDGPAIDSILSPEDITKFEGVLDPETLKLWRQVRGDNIVEDVSGQYFVRVSMDVRETGFLTSLNPPKVGAVGRLLKNTSRTLDQRLFEGALEAGNLRNRLLKAIDKKLTSTFRGLRKADRNYLIHVIAKEDNMGKWLTEDEFKTIWKRATGRPATDNIIAAKQQYMINNDFEYTARNAVTRIQKAIRGFESAAFEIHGQQFDMDVIVDTSPSEVPKERVYDISNDRHYTSKEPLTRDRLRELREQGLIMFQTEQPLKLADGTTVRRFLARRDVAQVRPLRETQIPYRPGGHRLYASKYFVKQAQTGFQPDTGTEFALNPGVHVTAPTVKLARDWADVMNQARLAAKEGAQAGELDELVFVGRRGFPTGKEFLENVDKGVYNLDHPFEAVFDRELPSFYKSKQDISKFLDEDEVGFNGYYRTTGRMYYSPKGEHLPDYLGQPSPTLDPFEAQARSLNNVANLSTFSDFKTSAVDRWVSRYAGDLEGVKPGSPLESFNAATVKRDVDYATRNQIEAQREAIKRILGFETPFDRAYRSTLRSMSEWVAGEDGGQLRQWAAKAPLWLQDKNPLTWLRGLAFDAKLGLFNPGQFVVQTSTMASAFSLSPKFASLGMASGALIRAFILSKGDENVLELLAKRGGAKLGGFASNEEFKNYARWALRSGFFDLGDTHVMVNAHGYANTFSSFGGVLNSIREGGRKMFYEAEIWNRLVAQRIAYGEAVERFGLRSFDDGEFRQFIGRRAENYSFNMSDGSKSMWQTGLLSIPTQFWAYNVRMIEALTGKNFTAGQKLRLLMMQMGLAGTAGVPLLPLVMDWRNRENNGAPPISSLEGVFQRGIFDRMVYEMFGADVQIGAKWGTGSWSSDLVRNVFGQSQYNNQTFADIMGGATYTILSQALEGAWKVWTFWMTHESGAETNTMTQDQIISVLRNISTFNNFTKALMIHQYGVYQGISGTTSISGLPSQDAVFVALGFQPGEQIDALAMRAHTEHRQEAIQEYSTEINRLLVDSINIPDHMQQNAQAVNLLINLVPIDMRREVLRHVHGHRDPSIYSRLTRIREESELRDQVDQEVTNSSEDGTNGSPN